MNTLMVDVEAALRQVAERTRLTPAEARELRLMVAGFSGSETAMALDLSKETVRARRKAVLRALGASCALDAVAIVLGTRQLADEVLANRRRAAKKEVA